MPRTELESTLHRLANYLECQLAEVFQQLLSESRATAVGDLAWSGSRLIRELRNVRDGKEGGDE